MGTGTGKYKDRQLFRARQNHASLVPVMGLMKESEFYQSSSPSKFSSEYFLSTTNQGDNIILFGSISQLSSGCLGLPVIGLGH